MLDGGPRTVGLLGIAWKARRTPEVIAVPPTVPLQRTGRTALSTIGLGTEIAPGLWKTLALAYAMRPSTRRA